MHIMSSYSKNYAKDAKACKLLQTTAYGARISPSNTGQAGKDGKMDGNDVLNVKEAAELLRVNAVTVRALAHDGAIPAAKVGNQWRFTRDALMAYLRGEYEREAPRTKDE